MSDGNEQTTTAAPTTRKPRTPDEYKIQQSNGSSGGWTDMDTLRPIKDAADARKYLREQGLTGDFRVIAVKDVLKVRAEQKTVFKFE